MVHGVEVDRIKQEVEDGGGNMRGAQIAGEMLFDRLGELSVVFTAEEWAIALASYASSITCRELFDESLEYCRENSCWVPSEVVEEC